MATPFDRRGKLDRTGVARLVEYLIAGGVHGVFVGGSQGEFFALTGRERASLIEMTVKAVSARVPIYAGVAGITTREAMREARVAESAGADALSVLTPFFIRPSPSELHEHFSRVAACTGLPILMYSNPEKTGVRLDPLLVRKLEAISNIVGIKDSSGDMTLTMEYIRGTTARFAVLAGRDTLIYPTLACGGSGAVAATANVVPSLCVEIYESYRAGDNEKAVSAQRLLTPLRLAFELGTFPGVVKEALSMIGVPVGAARAPVGPMSDTCRDELKLVLQNLEEYWGEAQSPSRRNRGSRRNPGHDSGPSVHIRTGKPGGVVSGRAALRSSQGNSVKARG